MASFEEFQQAQINRSIRTIKAELEYLCDATIISPATLSDLLSRIPPQTALHAPLSVGAIPPPTQNVPTPAATPGLQSPMHGLSLQPTRTNGSISEKQEHYAPPAQPPPPSYTTQAASPPPPPAAWPALCHATALYAYTPSDAGDLELQPNDHVAVTEYMNAEWWKGRCSRTGQEGIFPRSYVKIVDEKAAQQNTYATNTNGATSTYGNMPLETSGMGDGTGKVPGKAQEQGKKFGKKLGNAAIFGAGATIGGNIVNSIF